MKKFKIFLSKKDFSFESAKKIELRCKLETEIIYLEDYSIKKIAENINENDILYFLCNDVKIHQIIQLIKDKKCIIINKDFFLNEYTKEDVQKKLFNNGILTPKIISKVDLSDIKFPLFCKENTHTAITVQMYNKSTYNKFFKKFNIDDFYLEEVVGSNIRNDNDEIKVYVIGNQVFVKDNQADIGEKIKEICKKISKILDNIEVFSVDFIIVQNNYYVIDLNPASGFFHSTNARNKFIEEIECR